MDERDYLPHAKRGQADGIHIRGSSFAGETSSGSSAGGRTGGSAVFHFSAKAISRGAGRSVTAAMAYRAGEEITDERTGEIHNYTRKEGVEHAELVLPGGGTAERAAFWNGIEAHHKRGDAILAREVEVSLPSALDAEQRRDLAMAYGRELADRYGVAADVAVHAPRTITDKDIERNPAQYYETDPDTGRRHNGNWHAHIMLSACHVSPEGVMGKKAVALDPIASKRAGKETMVQVERQRWGELQNERLRSAGIGLRVDHRSLADQGKGYRTPTRHLGPQGAAIERRTGASRRREDLQADGEREIHDKILASNERDAIGAAIERTEIELGKLRQELGEERPKTALERLEERRKTEHQERGRGTAKELEMPAKSAQEALNERREKGLGKDKDWGLDR